MHASSFHQKWHLSASVHCHLGGDPAPLVAMRVNVEPGVNLSDISSTRFPTSRLGAQVINSINDLTGIRVKK